MRGQSYSITAGVSIKPTLQTPEDLAVDPLWQLASGQPIAGRLIERDLEAVTVTNSLGREGGTFQLRLAPRAVVGGDSWDKLIRPYSLVTIALHRIGPAADPACTPAPEPVMIGLVDKATRSEDYGSAEPQRRITVTGRSLAALLVDHKWWFHRYIQTQLPADLRSAFSPAPSVEMLRDETDLRAIGFLAIDPEMFKTVVNGHPVNGLETAYRFFVGTPDKPGFIKVAFADGRPLSYRLLFEPDVARAAFFDDGARLGQQTIPTQMPHSSCWELMQYFCETPFTEIFTDSYGENLDNARCVLTVRKPPWLGHVAYGDNGAMCAPADLLTRAGSLFEDSWGTWDRQSETIEVGGSDVIAMPSITRGLPDVFTAYNVLPTGSAPATNNGQQSGWEWMIPPTFDEDPQSPSFIRRYGIRPMNLATKYIPVRPQGATITVGDYQRRSLVYQALLRCWFYRNPAFWHGNYQLKGRTDLRIGKRLLDRDLKREFYITGVQHHMELSHDPTFTTSVNVARGWDL